MGGHTYIQPCLHVISDDLLTQPQDLSPADRTAALAALNAPTPVQADRIIVTQQSQFTRKLRLFSGRTLVPNSEVEFETWRLQVRQLVDEVEDHLSDKQIRRIIIQSLQNPALDTVKTHIGSTQQLLESLDNLYGSVVDSQELLIQYYSKYHIENDSSSTYLQPLYLLATEVVVKVGVTVPDLLLRQFIRAAMMRFSFKNLIWRI